jgi:chemotaxis protein methyltransferase CheR
MEPRFQTAQRTAQHEPALLHSTLASDFDFDFDLGREDFSVLQDLMYERFGLHLTDDKRSMVAVRLQKMLRKLRIGSVKEFLAMLTSQDSALLVELLNHLTTNHTFFYRESDHFDYFVTTALPELTARLRHEGTLDLRVWSAGCSSGEEPYMLLMLMMEYFGAQYKAWDAGILATDISERSLETARNGVYDGERMRMLPDAFRAKYFRRLSSSGAHLNTASNGVNTDGSGENLWEIVPALRNEATFRHFNLMNTRFPFKKKFHAIFCRNVMIYFDKPTREVLAERFYQALEPGGYLFIGHSETFGRNQNAFEYIMPAVYRKRS